MLEAAFDAATAGHVLIYMIIGSGGRFPRQ
jgi:hypothetical protein